ncbi:UDP-glucuronosyl/UDP-glucosyltransferase [Artemisia annua]|uniref:Glycosyltransferase n=1 Tax=Artemisia annua TaxID=35608 RepID=A0A2U1MN71_ARTAN|nr:UDP-glucuronosyl/UDP-glucosyltransferase [Artemisia annua]
MNQVVVIPYPIIGHTTPLLNFCNKLSSFSSQKNTLYTVVITQHCHTLIASHPPPDNVRFVTVPNVTSPYSPDTVAFYIAAQNAMQNQLVQFLDRVDDQLLVKYVIADVMMRSAFEVANKRKIPVAAFWSMSASMFTFLYHAESLDHFVHTQMYGPGSEEIVEHIPVISPISLADLPWPNQIFREVAPHLKSLSKIAKSLLLSTIYELESDAIDEIRSKVTIPVYAVGPNIPDFHVQRNMPSDESSYVSWLDSKPRRSVLYVSLGSLISVSSAQIDELLDGLKQSGVNFLWAARGEKDSRLSGDCGSNGLVVDWCDQWRVLSHSSVGGFMSHCGWNSTKESLFLGVPVLTFPIIGDQLLNKKLTCDDWKNGLQLKAESYVKREVIEVAVRQFMDLESEMMTILMENLKRIEGICRESVEKGGQTNIEIDCFIKESGTYLGSGC